MMIKIVGSIKNKTVGNKTIRYEYLQYFLGYAGHELFIGPTLFQF